MLYIVKQYKSILFSMLENSFEKRDTSGSLPDKKQVNDDLKQYPEGFEKEKQAIQDESREGREELKKELTYEQLSNGTNSFLGIKMKTESREELLDSINKGSLEQLLVENDHSSLAKLIGEIQQVLGEDPRTFKYFSAGVVRNYSKIKPILKKAGYDIKGFLGQKEAFTVVTYITDQFDTENLIKSKSDVEKIKLLLDFDKDGFLETAKSSGVGEAQMQAILNGLTSDNFSTLLKNLSLSQDILDDMSNNLAYNRHKFQNALKSMIEMGVNPAELVKEGATKKAFDRIHAVEMLKLQSQSEKSVKISEAWDELKNNAKLAKKLAKEFPELSEEDRTKLLQKLKPDFVGLALVDGTVGLGAGYAIQNEKINAFIDSISAGVTNSGLVGVSISKTFLKRKGWNIKGSLTNIIIPAVSISKTFASSIEESKDFSRKTMKNKGDVSVHLNLAEGVSDLGLTLSRKDENTKSGIDAMVKEQKKFLENALSFISDGKEFNDFASEHDIESTKTNIEGYTRMKAWYDTYTSGENSQFKEVYLENMLNGVLANYENELYNNKDKRVLTSIGFGVLSVSHYLPLPYITIGGETKEISYKDINDSLSNVRENTETVLSLENIGARVESYNGNTVLAIDVTEHGYNVSDSTDKAQYEVVGNTMYLGGDIPSSVKVDEYFQHDSIDRTIVIGEGVKDKKTGVYINTTNPGKIDKSISGLEKVSLSTYEAEAYNSTNEARNAMGKVIGLDALKHKDTVGMMKLQRDIDSYLDTGKPNLGNVWKDLLAVFTTAGFEKYSSSNGNLDSLNKLNTSLSSVDGDLQKEAILQTYNRLLMRKGRLENNGGIVTIDEGKNPRKYDEDYNRDNFFDSIFTKEFSPAFTFNLNKAREQWYNSNNSTEYSVVTVSGNSVNFTGTHLPGKGGRDGITTFTGAYNIAHFEGGKDFVEIPGDYPEVINKIPDRILERYRKQINSQLDTDLKTTQEAKDFINNETKKDKPDRLVSYDLRFSKAGECLNDNIDLQLNIKGGVSLSGTNAAETYRQINDVNGFGVLIAPELERDGSVTTTPGVDGVSTTPGNTDGTPSDGEPGNGAPVDTGGGRDGGNNNPTPTIPPTNPGDNSGGRVTPGTGRVVKDTSKEKLFTAAQVKLSNNIEENK